MPRATYCRPQIASIGRTEAECEHDGIPYKTGKFPWIAIGKALIGGDYEGFAKVIAHKETDEIVGVHLIGPHVTDLIAEASAAMLLEATAWELGRPSTRTRPLRGALGRPPWPSWPGDQRMSR
jgi:dihydrolipoamide dehydrogenase